MCLVIAQDKLPSGAEAAIEQALHNEAQASALLRLPGVFGLQVQRLARSRFETTATGKTPFFIELEATPDSPG